MKERDKHLDYLTKREENFNRDVINEGQQLVEFYKVGFLDGAKAFGTLPRREKKAWASIQQDCIEAFNNRFSKKLGKAVKKRLKGGKQNDRQEENRRRETNTKSH